MTSSEPDHPQETFIRLERDTPWGHQIGCSLVIAIVLLGISGTLVFLDPFGGGLGGLAVIVVFGGLGLLMLYMFVHQSIARRVPETIVEIRPQPALTGDTASIRITQPGPVKLRSLRAHLRWSREDGGGHSEKFLDVQNIDVGESWETVAEVVIPENAPPSGWLGGGKTVWMVEVWGRVRIFPDFLHSFVIKVELGEQFRTVAAN